MSFRTNVTARFHLIAACVLILLISSMSLSAAAEDVTLELIHCWGGVREPWIHEMLSTFEKANPGVKVDAQLAGCGNDIKEKVSVGIASNTLADVAMVHSDQIPTISSGLLPVNSFMARDNISREIWYPSEIAQGDWRGKTYAFPIRTGGDNNHLLFWNKRLFAEAGLDKETPPKLWDDLKTVSRKVVRYEGDNLVQGAINITTQPDRELSWLYTGDGALFNQDATRVTITTPEARNTLTFFRSLTTSLYRNPEEGVEFGSLDAFVDEKTAMHAKGASSIAHISQSNTDLDFGIGIMPRRTLDSPSGVHAGTWLYAISANTEHPDLAWKLLKWMTIRQESAGYFMLRQGRPSPVKAFNQDPRYLELNPYWNVIGEALQLSAVLPIFPGVREYMNAWRDAFRAVVIEGEPADSTLENTAKVLQGRLDEQMKQ